jgi:hypothetical protein
VVIRGDRSGRIRITKFTVFATSLSPYVQPPFASTAAETAPHRYVCVCLCVSTAAIVNKSDTRASQWELFHSNSSLGSRLSERYQLYNIIWRNVLNASLTSTEITDNEVYQVHIKGLTCKSSYINICWINFCYNRIEKFISLFIDARHSSWSSVSWINFRNSNSIFRRLINYSTCIFSQFS